MKSYELIIERRQPPCGGKPTKLHDFKTWRRMILWPMSGNTNLVCLKMRNWKFIARRTARYVSALPAVFNP